MLDLSILRHERDRVLQGLLIRNAPEAVIELVDKVIETDDLRRASQTERDQGRRPGLTTDERKRLKEQEREIRELRRANEILRKASAYFAQAELDRRPKS